MVARVPDHITQDLVLPESNSSCQLWLMLSGTVAEYVECRLRVRKVGSLIPGRVKPMIYKIDYFAS